MSELQKQVQDVIDGLVESGAENGVQAAVYRRGELIVDAVAGVADPVSGRPVSSDTLFYAASTVKGVTSTVVHVLVEEGVLSYDTSVASLWPEFGAHGKEGTTVRHVLTHSAGVPAVPAELTLSRTSVCPPRSSGGWRGSRTIRRGGALCFVAAGLPAVQVGAAIVVSHCGFGQQRGGDDG
jgi:CubicO group peptidase (beta-lactamase class C family)